MVTEMQKGRWKFTGGVWRLDRSACSKRLGWAAMRACTKKMRDLPAERWRFRPVHHRIPHRPISELRLLGHYVFASSVLGEEDGRPKGDSAASKLPQRVNALAPLSLPFFQASRIVIGCVRWKDGGPMWTAGL